ncbi:MAG: DUF456 family protein [Candidatus Eisenbacteria bacterium]|nr:DUF456 family protein [Candidatus Eisenbacteria bacterium]
MPWDQIGRVALTILLDLFLLVGLIAIPLGLSGTFILLAIALVVALATGFSAVPLWALLVMAALVVLGEILEQIVAGAMVKRYGASNWGMVAALIGGIIGAILGAPLFPVLGSLVGSFIGAALGAVLVEWYRLRKLRPSMPAGWGAVVGKVLSSLLKIAIGLAIAIYLVVRTH